MFLTARNTTKNTEPVSLPESFAECGWYDLQGIIDAVKPEPGDRIEIDGEPFYFVAVPFQGRLWLAKFRADPGAYSNAAMTAIIAGRNGG